MARPEIVKYTGKNPDCGIESTGSTPSPTPSVDVAGALSSARSALQHLLASNGWKNARKQNRQDLIFYTTEIGKCELQIRDVIKKLGG